jgi:hypothetical protein
MKLYEVLLRKIGLWKDPADKPEKPQEDMIYNPIGCKVGDVLKIGVLDLRDCRFTVREILEYSIVLCGNKHRMVDYILDINHADKRKLRIAPDPDSKSQAIYGALLLSLYDEFVYNEDLHAVVQDDTKKLVIDDETNPDNAIHEEFWRVNDVGSSYKADVKKLVDIDGDGKISEEEVKASSVEFWDYSRMTNVEGVEIEEFMIVEMDETGYFTLWRGSEVNPERISVF